METTQLEMQSIQDLPKKPKKSAKEVWGIVGTVIKWVLIGLCALLLISNVVCMIKMKNGNPVPTFLGVGSAKVVTRSMEPTIMVGDVVVIAHKSSYKVGDVITFIDTDGKPVTHRIIEITNDGKYATKGDYIGNSADANFKDDNEIVGKVIATLPKFGYFLDFLKSGWGIALLVIVAIILVELPALIDFIRKSIEKNKLTKQINALEAAGEGSAELSGVTADGANVDAKRGEADNAGTVDGEANNAGTIDGEDIDPKVAGKNEAAGNKADGEQE